MTLEYWCAYFISTTVSLMILWKKYKHTQNLMLARPNQNTSDMPIVYIASFIWQWIGKIFSLEWIKKIDVTMRLALRHESNAILAHENVEMLKAYLNVRPIGLVCLACMWENCLLRKVGRTNAYKDNIERTLHQAVGFNIFFQKKDVKMCTIWH
jgi:hypothetical protein